MDQLATLRLFARIVELGSFTQAANALDLPRATATNAIKDLEARLGARLLERTTRQVRTTPDGEAFYERIVRVLADLDEAESALSSTHDNPRGSLRVNMHGTVATDIVLPRIGEFHQRYPHIELVLTSADRLVDLIGEGVDCVIRGGELADSSLVARRLALMPEVTCASPGYLGRFGTPRHPGDLAGHRAVNYFHPGRERAYPFTYLIDGQVREFAVPGWISVDHAETYVAAAEQGCGLIQLPRYHVERQLRAGSLVEVLADWPSTGLPVALVYPRHRQLSRRLRVFADWCVQVFAERFP